MHNEALRRGGCQGTQSIYGNKNIGFMVSQYGGNSYVIPVFPKQRMTRRRAGYYRSDIRRKKKSLIKWPVEDKNELMLRVILGQVSKDFKNKIPITF